MNMQQLRRRQVARVAHQAAMAKVAQEYSDYMHAQAAQADDWWDDDESPLEDATCQACDGTGGDKWSDGVLPCEHCDGQGYSWWR